MIKRTFKIGNFGVNPIGIGTWDVGGGNYPNPENEERDISALLYSLSKGQNHIDTAELYGQGHSEVVVGKAVKKIDRKKVFIATKVWGNNATADKISHAAENSLKRLDTDYIDLLYIHACWDEDKIAGYIKGLNKAVDLGLARAIGLSNFNLKQLNKALTHTKHPIVALQNHYNVTHQHEVNNDMKAFCNKNNITIVAYSPLGGCENSQQVLQIANKYKKTPAQIALNWLISQEGVVTIPKSTDKKHIDENLGALDFELEKDDLKLLSL